MHWICLTTKYLVKHHFQLCFGLPELFIQPACLIPYSHWASVFTFIIALKWVQMVLRQIHWNHARWHESWKWHGNCSAYIYIGIDLVEMHASHCHGLRSWTVNPLLELYLHLFCWTLKIYGTYREEVFVIETACNVCDLSIVIVMNT